jgi:imidazoleglycerol phosphate synthase glutamine amidotransferase subunit HisH
MGWDQLELLRDSRLLSAAGGHPYVYFAHSYYVPVVPEASAICDYTIRYTAVLEHHNISGVQFHPEKSGPVGLSVIRNFSSC